MTNARQAKSAREKAAEMRAQAQRHEARRRNLLVAGVMLAVMAVIIGTVIIVRLAQHEQETANAVNTPANVTEDGGFVVGEADAPVTLVIYEDFLCPACKTMETLNGEQITQWIEDAKVKVEYRVISILDRASTDGYSTRSANAAAAVANAAPDAWAEFHRLLFAEQPAEGGAGLSDDRLIELAVQAGATESAVRDDIEDKAFAGWVTKMTDESSKAGITSTPTLIVNGKKLDNYSPDIVRQAVEEAAKG